MEIGVHEGKKMMENFQISKKSFFMYFLNRKGDYKIIIASKYDHYSNINVILVF